MLPEPLFLNIHMYGIMILEYLRGDNRGELIGLITPSQFWSDCCEYGNLYRSIPRRASWLFHCHLGSCASILYHHFADCNSYSQSA